MSTNHNHPFHLVTISPWPIINAFNLMNLLLSLVMWFFYLNSSLFFFNMFILISSMFLWWRDVIRESTFQGFHSLSVMKLMKFSMILFIISELFFFISLFWAYFHAMSSPSIEIGLLWPPKNIIMFNPFSIPLLNSLILISSGISLTWSHNSLLNSNYKESMISLMITIILGMYFSSLQFIEYLEAPFCLNDSTFGSIFFMTTGFHGLHVIIGIIFLSFTFIRLINLHFSSIHHFNFEAASWYWHFVDVIWLFLYISIYWWMF
uniref:Cytochrome c oxidase subunit 3 n=1 Tax=Osmia excavata TaxID=124290 RepID=A0A2R2Z387_9HYME|nr:cytochrome c oxidase subunit 3 [Osmia excavata]